jgi:hypothetical protein
LTFSFSHSGNYPNPQPNPAQIQMGGYQQLVRGEAMRGKFQNSFERPEPFEPRKVTKVEYVLPDAYHSFRRGKNSVSLAMRRPSA